MYPISEVHEVGRVHGLTSPQVKVDVRALKEAGMVRTEHRAGGQTNRYTYTTFIGLTPDGMQAIDRRGR
jgi:predicted transcriptional regulator